MSLKKFSFIFFVFLSVFASKVHAENGYMLAKKHMCTMCHSLDRKLIGPTWMNVSMKYQSMPNAEAYLIRKIRSGGTGTWGSAVMPPTTQVGEEDIKHLAQYVLKLSRE